MKERPMRWVFCIMLSLGIASPALASDYDLPNVPVLRGSAQPPAPVVSVGPATFTRWSGFYFGGDVSYNSGNSDFSTASGPLVAFTLQGTALQQQFTPSQLQLLGRGADNAFGSGAFLGYNTQWQDLVLGVEANYTHTSLNMTPPSTPISRSSLTAAQLAAPQTIPPGTVTSFNLKANGHLDLTDYAEARGRAGYVVGNLLPYGFIGVVVGRSDYSVSATTNATCTQQVGSLNTMPCSGFPPAVATGQSNGLMWGYSVGAGLDWALTPSIFVRGEFDFDQFAPISNVSVTIASGRVGAGFKF
jgi:outer membrane immunogenic protein